MAFVLGISYQAILMKKIRKIVSFAWILTIKDIQQKLNFIFKIFELVMIHKLTKQ